MRIVALYKTWDGGEFVDASLASIYDHCEAIVMVHSDISWLGERGNTVRQAALEWCNQQDRESKVHHVDVSLTSQEAQYAAGLDYIAQRKIQHDAILAVDADEVWEGQYLERAKQQATDRPAIAYRCNMHTFLKAPFYRVWPPFGTPTVLLRDGRQLVKSPRGCRAPAEQFDNVWMHHFTYVRESRDLVARKLDQSCLGDSGEMVVPHWMETVYDRLPFGHDLHGFVRWREVWHRIEKVWLPELPPAMRAARLLSLWLPPGEMLDGEIAAIQRLSKGRTQAVDLGTYRGRSAVALSVVCDHVHTVDCYEDVAELGSFADTLNPRRYETELAGHSLEATRALCERLGNITFQKSDTAQAAFTWTGRPVDVLFVDADHAVEATRRNVEAWWPHMASTGRVIFHDDNEIHPGVQEAVVGYRADKRFRPIDCGEWSGSLAAFEVVK